MAFTQTQLDLLNNAIAQGVLEVKYADKTVIYRSLSEMMAIRDTIKTELGQGRSRRRYAKHNKGLGYITPDSTLTGA